MVGDRNASHAPLHLPDELLPHCDLDFAADASVLEKDLGEPLPVELASLGQVFETALLIELAVGGNPVVYRVANASLAKWARENGIVDPICFAKQIVFATWLECIQRRAYPPKACERMLGRLNAVGLDDSVEKLGGILRE
jgi:hypothetical protein